MIIEAREVTVRRGGRTLLDSVTMSAAPGEVLAVIGPNGSGKTTLFRTLTGLIKPSSGSVLLDGVAVHRIPAGARAKALAAVAAGEDHLSDVSLFEAVMFGRYARLGSLQAPTAADILAVRDAIERSGLGHLSERPTESLSSGELQLARIARALAQQPKVLLLDEPTSALDPRYTVASFELFRDLARHGLAVLVVTHDLNAALRYADRVMLLVSARFTDAGSPSAVVQRPALSEAFGCDMLPVTVGVIDAVQVVPRLSLAR